MNIDTPLNFSGQNVVLTGASSGIGAALARELVAAGANVFTATTAQARIPTLEAVGVRAFVADFADGKSLEQWIMHLQSQLNSVAVLVHSAAIIQLGPVESVPVSDLDRQYAVNVRAPYRLTQALLPQIEAASGQVVFVNSSAGVEARPNVGQYSATKHALRAIADALRGEVNARGIRVLTVYPGRTATPMQEAIAAAGHTSWNPEVLLQPSDVAGMILNALCLPSTAEVTDVHIRPMKK